MPQFPLFQLPPKLDGPKKDLPAQVGPLSPLSQLVDMIGSSLGITNPVMDEKASTGGLLGQLIGTIGPAGIMGILKGLPKAHVSDLVEKLLQQRQNEMSMPYKDFTHSWGGGGYTGQISPNFPNTFVTKAEALQKEQPGDLQKLRDLLLQQAGQEIPVYRGMMLGSPNDIQPIEGPTSFSLRPRVASAFGNVVVGTKVSPDQVLGVSPFGGGQEKELIVNMKPEDWSSVKVLREKRKPHKDPLPGTPSGWASLEAGHPLTPKTQEDLASLGAVPDQRTTLVDLKKFGWKQGSEGKWFHPKLPGEAYTPSVNSGGHVFMEKLDSLSDIFKKGGF